ncbi:MAG: VCBS repeat-containing protein [Chitinophagaceae bacterium]|nr:VCBS repeat-containing protein [Oligoflexus sp.]
MNRILRAIPALLIVSLMLHACKPAKKNLSTTVSTETSSPPQGLALVGGLTIKIMPLGDSITSGVEGLAGQVVNYGGYRAPLWKSLASIFPGQIDFVGSLINDVFPGDPPGSDANQEGHPGWTSEDLAANMAAWLQASNPNYILLMIGSNDVGRCLPWSTSETALNKIIALALANASVKRVIVANVTPLVPDQTGCRNNANINTFNASLKKWTLTRIAENKRLSFVDMNALSGLTRDDMSDTLHPNTLGYAKLANVWLNALTPFLAPRGDGSNDGKADVYWHNTETNQNLIWEMNGAVHTANRALPNTERGWAIDATVDMNGDGNSDLILRNYEDGRNLIWLMSKDSSQTLSTVALPPIGDLGWHIVGSADMNGDGYPDLQWQNWSSGSALTWVMGPGGIFLRMMPLQNATAANWKLVGVADFNHDGFPDEMWHNTDGTNLVWFLNEGGSQRIGEQALPISGPEWVFGGVGDFDADGWIDMVWHNTQNLNNRVWKMGMTRGLLVFTEIQFEPSPANLEMRGPK